jgi:hypothetical protein
MNYLTLIAQLLAVSAALSFVWVTLRAFRTHPGWGFGVLLLSPFSATLFGMKYWDVQKKPFLLYIITTVASIGLSLYLFSSWGGWELMRASTRVQQGILLQNLTTQDAEHYFEVTRNFAEKSGFQAENPRTMTYLNSFLEQQQEKQAELEAEQQRKDAGDNLGADRINQKVESVPAERTHLVYRNVPVNEARRYIGATVKVTRRNVAEKEYRLTGATSKSLQFTQRNSSGAYTFAFRMSDIESLRVLVKEPY